ncbi:hypothetical protein BJ322DRAFT_802960 [Thelephora terrestris]|uniref:F-box domain-containing protein n=1 Tax=Thelephora terrestris TaxID=56493 RepID=A0A9P6L6Y1_9AGAM|nr:hypothetical protein BJ322DRAFT_802960 [Thelephora terrestris]
MSSPASTDSDDLGQHDCPASEINIISIRALEEQIKEHEMAIVKLKRARNSFLNVSRLPPEILRNIFRWSVTRESDFERLEEGSHNFLLVCHHWLEVASRTPELWSFWGDNLQDWQKRHLQHPMAPLDLVLNGSSFRSEPPLNDSLHNALQDRVAQDTIRRIHLSADDSELLDSIISPLATCESDGIRPSGVQSIIVWDMSEYTSVDVSDFFAHHRFPELRCLQLENCTISSWDFLTSRTSVLTTLILIIRDPSPAPTVTSPQILSILRSNPSLQKITLYGCSVPEDGGDKSSRVPLTHLRRLALAGAPQDVFTLLHQLDYPIDLDEFFLNLTDSMIEDIPTIIGPFLRDHLRRRGRPQCGLELSLSNLDTIHFSVKDVGETDFSAPGPASMNTLVATLIQLDQIPPEDLLEDAVLDLIAHVPPEEVVHFRASSRPVATEAISTQLPYLKAIHLEDTSLHVAFPKSILDRDKIFPHLQHVFLDWSSTHTNEWSPLTAFLDHFASSGKELDTLEIGGNFEMQPRVKERIRRAVREFRIRNDMYYLF